MSKPIDLRSFSPDDLSEDEYEEFLLELPVQASWCSADGGYPGSDRTILLQGGEGFWVVFDDASGFTELDRDLTHAEAIDEWLGHLAADLVPYREWARGKLESLTDQLGDVRENLREGAIWRSDETTRSHGSSKPSPEAATGSGGQAAQVEAVHAHPGGGEAP